MNIHFDYNWDYDIIWKIQEYTEGSKRVFNLLGNTHTTSLKDLYIKHLQLVKRFNEEI